MAETVRSEGLWKRHFHWSVLLRWEVLGWILGSLLATAGILLFFDQYWLANACFIATSVFIFAKVVQVAVISDDPWWHRMAFTFVLFGVFGVVIVESVRGVHRWAIKHSDAGAPVSSVASVLRPRVKLAAYLQPKQPYSEGMIIGGISWSSHYVDVRLDIANGPTQIKDLDFSIELDTSIAAIGQISQFQGVTAFPDNDPPAAWLEGTDTQGKPLSVPIVPAVGMMRSSPIYRVHCTDVFADTVVHLVIASIALNQTTANGGLPQHLFAPRRAPRDIKVEGRYSAQEGGSVKWYPFEFAHEFVQAPETPRDNPPRVKGHGPVKPVTPAPLLAHIRIGSQKQVTSTDPDLPYGVEIVLQTDIAIDPVAFAVKCTGTIGHGQAGFVSGGNYDQFATGMAGNNSNTFEFEWKSPAFTADKPIRVTLYSKEYIQVVDVTRLNYSWNP